MSEQSNGGRPQVQIPRAPLNPSKTAYDVDSKRPTRLYDPDPDVTQGKLIAAMVSVESTLEGHTGRINAFAVKIGELTLAIRWLVKQRREDRDAWLKIDARLSHVAGLLEAAAPLPAPPPTPSGTLRRSVIPAARDGGKVAIAITLWEFYERVIAPLW